MVIMNRKVLTVFALLCFGAAVPAMAQMMPPPPPAIVTQGEATIKRASDRAWLSVATETRDPKAAEARRRNAEAMTAVQSALKGAGVKADAIRTTGFSLSPDLQWDNGRSILRGYIASNQVEVRIDDLNTLSDVVDAVNSPKGVALTVNGPRFDLKDEKAAENEALKLAVESAMSRAQAIAVGAKRTLGQIVRIEDQNTGPIMAKPMQMMAMRAGAAAQDVATPITPGEIEVRAQVSLTVELK